MGLTVGIVVLHVVQRLEGHLDGQVVAVGARVVERGADGRVSDVWLAVLPENPLLALGAVWCLDKTGLPWWQS